MNDLQYFLENNYAIPDPALFIAENFEFKENDYSDLSELSILFREVNYLENRDILQQKYYLGSKESNLTNLELTFFICLDGAKTAFTCFYEDTAANSRSVSEQNIENLAKSKIGEIALMWSHSGVLHAAQLGFLRHNIYVSIKTHHEKTSAFIKNFASELDQKINSLATAELMTVKNQALFSIWEEKQYQIPKVTVGESLDLGKLLSNHDCFYTSQSGSINRRFDEPDFWYYRAGLQKGRQKLCVVEVNHGILPEKSEFYVELI